MGDVVARIQFPNFATRREIQGRGRPPKSPEFEVRVAQGGYSVYLSRTGKRIEYCCFMPAGDFSKAANYPFEEFVAWTLGRMRGRERTEENAAKIERLLSVIEALVAEGAA